MYRLFNVKLYIQFVLAIVSISSYAGTIRVVDSFPMSETEGAGGQDIRVVASASRNILQFGDEVTIRWQVTNLGPNAQDELFAFTLEFIQGLGFPIVATCDIAIIVSRTTEGFPSGFSLGWFVTDLGVDETQECLVTMPVTNREGGFETISFTYLNTDTDPNPDNNVSLVTFNFLGLGGVAVPTLSWFGVGLLIILIFSITLLKKRSVYR